MTTIYIALLVLLAIVVSACTGALPPPPSQPAGAPSETEAEGEPVPIRVSVAPYFDYQMVTAAEDFGWDDELGVDLQITYMQDNAGQVAALTNDSLDVSALCLVCNFQFYGSQPELRTFMTTNQFKGFAVIGRKGQVKTYAEFLEELGDPEEAKQATLAQFKDSTWSVNLGPFETLISAMLSQADMTLDDIEVIGFSDDQKAALAFINGEGDFYTGSLPQETRLLLDFPDEFVNVGGDEIIGPAGLWFSNFAALDPWLQENEDAALKFMAMNYRFNRMMNECPSQAATILAEAVNAQTGSDFTSENAQFITQEFERYRSPQEELAETNNPDAPVYWGNSAKFYMDEQIRTEALPEGSTYQEFNPLDEWLSRCLPIVVKLDNEDFGNS
jgi:ABC-type nitrate/sulfonate/bicarbonate transport system substrate-binding protein